MTIETIAFLYPGAMGASLAATLHARQPGLTLLTHLGSRSNSTKSRAAAAGLQDVSISEIIQKADLVFSILPPSSAVELAQEIVTSLPDRDNRSSPLIYLDANAISPGTVDVISKILASHNVPFIDGCVIGGPSNLDTGYQPRLYLSSDPKWATELEEVGRALGGRGSEGAGLKVRVMDGAGEGAASALKMCYGGIGKGTTGLASLLVIAAHTHSPATAQALLDEMADSSGPSLKRYSQTIPDMIPKAYRFVGEMEEIASFITASLSRTSSPEDAKLVAGTYQGLAQVFQRVADDLKLKAEEGERAGEVPALLDWAGKAKAATSGPK